MDITNLSEFQDAVDAGEKEFSEVSKSIAGLEESEYQDNEAYMSNFYERIHLFMDKTTELVTSYREYIAALEDACTEQEE
ncbi:MAG: hypothetical protein EF813_08240 [Methanosarcinales archaeon]|nr:MAG: hypothetical protein EF813_08240 [Methanosarcinales archaeon]